MSYSFLNRYYFELSVSTTAQAIHHIKQMEQNKKRQLISLTSDACSNMITNVRLLRLSTLDLFNTLADGGVQHGHQIVPSHQSTHSHPQQLAQQSSNSVQSHHEKLYHQQNLSNIATSHVLCSSSIPSQRVQSQLEHQQHEGLIQYVGNMISSIAATIRSLDQDVNILMQNFQLINTGETVHLGLDSSLDKHNLYMDLCSAYKNYSKLHDYSSDCHAMLHQLSLKRVHKQTRLEAVSMSNQNQGSQQQQQQRSVESSIVATFNPYIYNKSISISRVAVTSLLETCLKKCDYMEGTFSQPFGVSTGVFQVSVNRVLKAILLMRGIVIDAVIVKAYHESFASSKSGELASKSSTFSPNGSQFVDTDKDDIDLWSESKYNVFRRLTHHANAAVLHFQYPTFPEIAIKSFLVSNKH